MVGVFMLILMPDVTFPVTPKQADALMVNAQQMNIIDAGLNDNMQRALGIQFDIYDLLAKTGGKIDYRRRDGHERLYADATAFVGSGSTLVTRHGDLKAAHLAIDYNDTQRKLERVNLPPLKADVHELLRQVYDLTVLPPREDDRIALYLRYILKK